MWECVFVSAEFAPGWSVVKRNYHANVHAISKDQNMKEDFQNGPLHRNPFKTMTKQFCLFNNLHRHITECKTVLANWKKNDTVTDCNVKQHLLVVHAHSSGSTYTENNKDHFHTMCLWGKKKSSWDWLHHSKCVMYHQPSLFSIHSKWCLAHLFQTRFFCLFWNLELLAIT